MLFNGTFILVYLLKLCWVTVQPKQCSWSLATDIPSGKRNLLSASSLSIASTTSCTQSHNYKKYYGLIHTASTSSSSPSPSSPTTASAPEGTTHSCSLTLDTRGFIMVRPASFMFVIQMPTWKRILEMSIPLRAVKCLGDAGWIMEGCRFLSPSYTLCRQWQRRSQRRNQFLEWST